MLRGLPQSSSHLPRRVSSAPFMYILFSAEPRFSPRAVPYLFPRLTLRQFFKLSSIFTLETVCGPFLRPFCFKYFSPPHPRILYFPKYFTSPLPFYHLEQLFYAPLARPAFDADMPFYLAIPPSPKKSMASPPLGIFGFLPFSSDLTLVSLLLFSPGPRNTDLLSGIL